MLLVLRLQATGVILLFIFWVYFQASLLATINYHMFIHQVWSPSARWVKFNDSCFFGEKGRVRMTNSNFGAYKNQIHQCGANVNFRYTKARKKIFQCTCKCRQHTQFYLQQMGLYYFNLYILSCLLVNVGKLAEILSNKWLLIRHDSLIPQVSSRSPLEAQTRFKPSAPFRQQTPYKFPWEILGSGSGIHPYFGSESPPPSLSWFRN